MKHDLTFYNIDGYVMYTCCRSEKNGGGVGIYVKKNCHKSKIIDEVSKPITGSMESVFVNVSLNNFKAVKIGCIYKAPNTDILKFNDDLHDILSRFTANTLYLCGDYNIDLLKYDHQCNFLSIRFHLKKVHTIIRLIRDSLPQVIRNQL